MTAISCCFLKVLEKANNLFNLWEIAFQDKLQQSEDTCNVNSASYPKHRAQFEQPVLKGCKQCRHTLLFSSYTIFHNQLLY